MVQDLFDMKEYGLLAFDSTAQALKAERVLKEAGTKFLMIPVPRQISASCGLAVKLAPESLDGARAVLETRLVRIGGVYRISGQDGSSQMEKLI